MPLGDQVGTIAVQKINNEVLPHAAKLASDILTQAAVLLTGAITALDGERQLLMADLKPYLVEIQRFNDTASELSATLKTAVALIQSIKEAGLLIGCGDHQK